MQEKEESGPKGEGGERRGSDRWGSDRWGSERWGELWRQVADWFGGAALRSLGGGLHERLRERLHGAVAAWRREMLRVAVLYVLCRLLALFLWGAALLGALAVLLAWWDGHRVLATLSVAGAFLLIAIACAIAVARLGRPRPARAHGGANNA